MEKHTQFNNGVHRIVGEGRGTSVNIFGAKTADEAVLELLFHADPGDVLRLPPNARAFFKDARYTVGDLTDLNTLRAFLDTASAAASYDHLASLGACYCGECCGGTFYLQDEPQLCENAIPLAEAPHDPKGHSLRSVTSYHLAMRLDGVNPHDRT